jgi:2-phospho-L-lactate/phosphoenolpyruvate guanylyltransferase
MRTIAILPVKSFSAAKQRLATVLGGGSRQALAQAMFADVLTSLRYVDGLEAIAVVTRDRTAESTALASGDTVVWDHEETGQTDAALAGVRHALAGGFERVLLVAGDTPLIDPAELTNVLARAEEAALGAVVVPDRHGTGTNALVLRPPDAVEPSFGPGSLDRHVEAARAAGVTCSVDPLPSLVLDVDTPEDLAELATLVEERRGLAPQTQGALRQLDRSRARMPARTSSRQRVSA